MKIIGIHGKARSGKDTIAEHLVENHNFIRVAIADKIKLTASTMFNVPIEYFYDIDKKEIELPEHKLSPRRMAQLLGTEAGRKIFGDNVWFSGIEKLIHSLRNNSNQLAPKWLFDLPLNIQPKYRNLDCYMGGIVISDVRMDFEIEWIYSLGGKVWGVTRDNAINVEGHVTEQGIDMTVCDIVFENNQTIKELYNKIDEYI